VQADEVEAGVLAAGKEPKAPSKSPSPKVTSWVSSEPISKMVSTPRPPRHSPAPAESVSSSCFTRRCGVCCSNIS
jgi:hypothetical protein